MPTIAPLPPSLRVLLPVCVGALLCLMVMIGSRFRPSGISPAAIAVVLLLSLAIAEVCLRIGTALDRRGRSVALQVLTGSLAAAALTLLVYVPIKLWLIAHGENDRIGVWHLLLVGGSAAALAVPFALAQAGWRMHRRWRDAELAALQARHAALRARVDPHFLFNTLNALYGCIGEDAARAQAMVLRLSELLRSTLRHGESDAVPLADELAVAQAYVALMNLRHDDAIALQVDVDAGALPRRVPPMSLQSLVENAIKHTRFDAGMPLRVVIESDGDAVCVRNPHRPRTHAADGEGAGLALLRERLAVSGAGALRIAQTDGEFRVSLPLGASA